MRRRLLLSYLAVGLLVLAVLEIPLAVSYAHNERQDLAAKVERDAVALATLVEDALEHNTAVPSGVGAIAADYDADTGGRVLVVDRSGERLVDSAPTGSRDFSSRPEITAALAGEVATGTRASATLDTELLYVAVPVASSGVVHGAVRITYPTSAVESQIRRYWSLLAGIAAVVLALTAALAAALARWISRPLDRLERAADAIGAGDLAARAQPDGPPEVRRLAETFNATAAKLDALVRSQDAFVADASHQLRTPLTALRLRLENLDRDVADPGKPELDGALAEVERLSALVDALLRLARADRAATHPEPTDVDLLVRDRVAAWTPLADEREVALEAHVEPGLAALATPGHVEQVLDNLLANALDVAPTGTAITLTADAADTWAVLHVTDQGPGMSPTERERAFDRFWRDRDDQEGFGLGLAIVERLVTADGGEVELREAPHGGVDAVVRLPRITDHTAAARGQREPHPALQPSRRTAKPGRPSRRVT
jgi:signal transduction histidine kinase